MSGLKIDPELKKAAEKERRGAKTFSSFGDVIKLDLASDNKFGEIEVLLDSLEVYRILEYALEKIPTKTSYQEKCLSSIKGVLLKHPKIPMIIHPVLNKEILKACEAYNV